MTPTVSVVIPVHNAMPYLVQCIEAALRQSIGRDRLEIIAVDDGSTDGSSEALDKFAADNPETITVVHREASGTPAVPRNVGLGLARGEYLFFCDADDYLGDEGLERMVAMAEEHGSDVVLGKMKGVGGRGEPTSMFKENQPSADLYSSRIYWTIGPWKMFRRSLLIDHAIRFPEGRRGDEDKEFVFRAYFHARNISVVADYDCYYIVQREDGGNLTGGNVPIPEGRHFAPKDALLEMAEIIAAHVPAGPKRDYLMKRHWEVEGETRMAGLARQTDPDRIAHYFEVIREPTQLWYTPGAAKLLTPVRRLKYQLVLDGRVDDLIWVQQHEDQTVYAAHEGRLYLTLPGRERDAHTDRAPSVDVTDAMEIRHWLRGAELTAQTLRIEGTGRIAPVPSERIRLRLEAVHRRSKTVHAFDLEHVDGHFAVSIPLTEIFGSKAAQGNWHFQIVVLFGDCEFRAPFGRRLGGALSGRPHPRQALKGFAGQRTAVLGFDRDKQMTLSIDHRSTARRLAGKVYRKLRGKR